MSTNRTSRFVARLLVIVLACAAIGYSLLVNYLSTPQGVQAETISAVKVHPYQESITIVPTTYTKHYDVVVYSGSSDVIESLCNDPLLGPSAIINSNCYTVITEHKERDNTPAMHTTVTPPLDNTPKKEEDSPKEDKPDNDKSEKVKSNNGHGNNEDGIDCSNPGNGPKNDPAVDSDPTVDDEKVKKEK